MSLTWSLLNEKLMAQAKKKGIPLIGQFELTARCNLQCKMCYVCKAASNKDIQNSELSAEEWIKLAQEARDAGMLYLLLTGGEVFLRRDFKEIYEAVSMMGFSLEIYTNATMITPEISSWVGRTPPSKIGVTLYGASRETYGKVCGCEDGFDRALQGIDLLLDKGIYVDLRTTVIRDNMHEFDQLARIADERGIQLSVVNYISPRGRNFGISSAPVRLYPEELAVYEKHIEKYFKICTDRNLQKETGAEGSTNIKSKGMNSEELRRYLTDDIFNCAAAKCSFWVTWDGKMTPCGLMEKPVAAPFENGFSKAWTRLQELYNSLEICQKCNNCELLEYCMPCPAMFESETGTFEMPGEYLCRLAKERSKINEF